MARRFMPRHCDAGQDASSGRRSSSSKHRVNADDRSFRSGTSEGIHYSDRRESCRSDRESPSDESGSSKEDTRNSRGGRKRSSHRRCSSKEGSPRGRSRSPRKEYGTPTSSDDEYDGSSRDSEDATEDDDGAATPARRYVPPPRERPLSVITFPEVQQGQQASIQARLSPLPTPAGEARRARV
ncbi:hypothetical protein MTO96_032321 [Rhipicephalus appendiculatus]